MTEAGAARRGVRAALPALLLAVAVYAPGWGHDFVWDDVFQIRGGVLVKDPGSVGRLFTTPFWANVDPDQAAADVAANTYRPLSNLTFLVTWAIAGDSPAFFHVENTLTHALCVLLLFLLWRRLTGDEAAAAWAAAALAVLPLCSEAVAYVSGRGDLHMTVATLASAHLYLTARCRRGRAAVLPAAGVALCYLVALLVKEPAVVLPALLLVMEGAMLPDGRARRNLVLVGALALPLVLYLAVRVQVLQGARVGGGALPLGRLLLEAPAVVGTFLSWALLPLDLSIIHPWRPPPVAVQGVTLVLALGIVGGMAWLMAARPARRPWAFAIAWFVVALAPAAAFAVLSGGLAERYAYLPAAGLCCGVGSAMAAARRALPDRRTLVTAGLAAVLGALAARTVARVGDWESDLTLLTAAVRADPEHPAPLYRLGTHLASIGDEPAALAALTEASRMAPEDPRQANNLGVLLRRAGRLDEALAVMRRALPAGAGDARLHYNLALVEVDLGLLDDAERHLARSLEIWPTYKLAHDLMGQVRTRRRRGSAAGSPPPGAPSGPAAPGPPPSAPP